LAKSRRERKRSFMTAAERHYYEIGQREGVRYAVNVPREAGRGVSGMQMTASAGASLEFMDHREYEPGDDLRWIDWGAYARSDKLVIKLYRAEVTPHVEIVVDSSRSMSVVEEKAGAAQALAALFAQAASNSDFSHRVWTAGVVTTELPNGRETAENWPELAFDAPSAEEGLLAGNWVMKPQSLRVIISDLFWTADPDAVLAVLREAAAAVYVVQVISRLETEPPLQGSLCLVDMENGQERELYIDERALQRYHAAFLRHREQWYEACRHYGAVMAEVTAEKVLHDWDLSALLERNILRVS